MSQLPTLTVIGAGRVGTALSKLTGQPPLKRGQSWLDAPPGPLVVCTRNDDLEGVIQATPTSRRGDLLFIQNGMIDPLLASHHLQGCSRALIYFAVSKLGQDPVDGGGTVVTGPWASSFCEALSDGGLDCAVVSRQSFDKQMVEKLLWNCVFGLLCQRHSASVGTLVAQQRPEIDALTQELAGVARRALHLSLDPGVSDRLCSYSLQIPDYTGAVRELQWRNGWFQKQENCPLQSEWLSEL